MDLIKFFSENPKVAVAFSGGVDSCYLLYMAQKYAKKVKAYFVKSQFQPEFELNDAIKMAKYSKSELKIINLDVLDDDNIAKNPENRCYYCKKRIFSNIIKCAKNDGFDLIIDGTNASDKVDDRPGMKALSEMKVVSPLRICNLTKDQIRKLSKESGLFTFDKPSYACLATRIKQGEYITEEKLKKTEICEKYLSDLGFSDFRIRLIQDMAKIQIKDSDFEILFKERKKILKFLKKYYSEVLVDLEER